MKSTVETLSPTRVRLDIEVPFDELKSSIDKAYKSIAKQVNVPGFRKGKVPPRLIDRHIGRGVVLDEALNNDAIPSALRDAFTEHDLRVLGRPEVDPKEFTDGEQFSFSADVEIRPALEVPEFAELEVLVDEVTVSDSDIDAEIDSVREKFGTLKGVDRPVADDDYLNIDLVASVSGEPVPDGSASDISYRVGSGDLLDGLDDAVRGATAGDDRTFTTTLVGGEFAGREADVQVTVRSVKVKELPEVDDEFVQMASEFDTIAELRDDAAARLGQQRQMSQALQARDRTLHALQAAIEVPVPERLLAGEIEFRQHQLEHQLTRIGMTLEQYLSSQETTEEEHTASQRSDAEDAIRAQLLLDTIAEREELGVNQTELTGEVVRRARQAYVDPQAFADHLVQSGQLTLVAADLRRGKALSLVLEQAKVVDTAGEPVDVTAVREQLPAG